MATFNGEAFLREQLESFVHQSHQNWKLIVSDDGSTDKTLEILSEYQQKWGKAKLSVRAGRQEGFAKNFLSLACDPDIKADCFMFADQDDIWLPNKIERALSSLMQGNPDKSKLYCGRTFLGNSSGVIYRESPLYIFPKNFRNAIVQCIAGGNTMAFNSAFKCILNQVGVLDVVSHDWWLYQLITAIEGDLFYDETPYMIYRQHGNQLVGGNSSIISKLNRIGYVLKGRFKLWNDLNESALCEVIDFMTINSRDVFNIFVSIRASKSIKDRVRLMNVSGIFRQSRRGTLALMVAIIINKV